jgi:hypothetical protein
VLGRLALLLSPDSYAFFTMKSSSVLDARSEPMPAGLVNLETMLAAVWPHEPSRPSEFKIRHLCALGLPHYRIGRRYFFRLCEVAKWVETLSRNK